jgi:hypothetical protein
LGERRVTSLNVRAAVVGFLFALIVFVAVVYFGG